MKQKISALESEIGDARRGLPEEVFLFVSRMMPLINVDLLIKDDRGRTLLTWRADEAFGAGWHIPGGIIRYKEVAARRVEACAREELGVEVDFDATPMFVGETITDQRNRGHFVSLLYGCRLLSAPDETRRAVTSPPRPGDWAWHDRCPPDLLPAQAQYRRFF